MFISTLFDIALRKEEFHREKNRLRFLNSVDSPELSGQVVISLNFMQKYYYLFNQECL